LNLATSFGSPSAVYPYKMVAYYQNDFVSEDSVVSFPYSGPLKVNKLFWNHDNICFIILKFVEK